MGAVPGTTIGAHPLVPDLRNRILRIKDSSDNDLEIHQVYIPLFDSEGFSDPNAERDRVRRVLDR